MLGLFETGAANYPLTGNKKKRRLSGVSSFQLFVSANSEVPAAESRPPHEDLIRHCRPVRYGAISSDIGTFAPRRFSSK